MTADRFTRNELRYGAKLSHWFPGFDPEKERIVAALPIARRQWPKERGK